MVKYIACKKKDTLNSSGRIFEDYTTIDGFKILTPISKVVDSNIQRFAIEFMEDTFDIIDVEFNNTILTDEICKNQLKDFVKLFYKKSY